MRKRFLSAGLIVALCGGMLCTSCIGTFSLTNKLLAWNQNVGDKIVNELVFLALNFVPAYEVAVFADAVVFNTIEFWTGSNPMASSKKVVDGKDGRYLVECDGKGYDITAEKDGAHVRLNFNEDSQTWSVALPSGEDMPLITFTEQNRAILPTTDGKGMEISLDNNGLAAYRAAQQDSFWAAR